MSCMPGISSLSKRQQTFTGSIWLCAPRRMTSHCMFCVHVDLSLYVSSPVQVSAPLNLPSFPHRNVDAPLPPFCSYPALHLRLHEGSVVEDSWKEAVALHGSLEPPSTPVGNVLYAGHCTSVKSNTVHRQHEAKQATHNNNALRLSFSCTPRDVW